MNLRYVFPLVSFSLFLSVAQPQPPVYVVLFTHIEDNTPSADIGTPQARVQYLTARNGMIEMAKLAKRYNVTWVFEPDWKLLLACLAYEDSLMMLNTGGKNVLRYLREDMGVPIDAHSHEKLGYNYTDVAHLLDSLGVGGSTVIGGHIWDPSIPQFQEWDRFRNPVAGSTYPWAVWRGNILMGSGTPNHVNDPYPSGIWRPKDRDHYWEDDPAGNIYCVGQYKGDVSGVNELVRLYQTGAVDTTKILTASFHIQPISIMVPANLLAVEDTVIKPLVALRARGEVELTDFTTLVGIWKSRFASKPHLYDGKNPPASGTIGTFVPSEAGGSEGIYVEIVVPDTARYSNGAPVVVHIAGGWGSDGLSIARDAVTPGFVEVRYNFPGGGSAGKASGGTFDDRGEQCIRATRDVVRFAMGKIPDRDGKYLRDLTGSVAPSSSNVGLCGWSNGGNATLTTAGMFGGELAGLAWIVNWESPVGDGMPSVEAGGKGNPNPAYDPSTGSWDLSTLAYSDTIAVSKPGLPVLRGGLYFDRNGTGRPDAGGDWFLTPYLYRSTPLKTIYSERIRNEAERRALIPAGAPPHVATTAETREFWRWRNAEPYCASAVTKNPGLMFIIAASDTDHVQGAPDHPHVLLQYQGMIDAGGRFVRLNADRAYCELAGSRPYPRAADSDAFRVFTHTDIYAGLEPEGADRIPDAIYVSAAIQELADRTRYNVLRPNLDAIIGPGSGTEARTAPGDGGYRLVIPSHPVIGSGRVLVSSPSNLHALIQIRDLAGRIRATIADTWLDRGLHGFSLPQLPAGTYIVTLRAGAAYVFRKYIQD